MDYSRNGSTGGGGTVIADDNATTTSRFDELSKNDWKCGKCGCDNFKRRLRCFRCGISKDEADGAVNVKAAEEERTRTSDKERMRKTRQERTSSRNLNEERSRRYDEDSPPRVKPSSTLLVHGLDALTTESGLMQAFSRVTDIGIKNIYVVRDETNTMSLGYGFVELYSKRDGEDLMGTISFLKSPFEVDGKAIIVDYSRDSFTNIMASLNHPPTDAAPGLGYEHRSFSDADQSYSQQQQQQQFSVYDNTASTLFEENDITQSTISQAAVQLLKAAKCKRDDRPASYSLSDVNTSKNNAQSSAAAAAADVHSSGFHATANSSNEYAHLVPPDTGRFVFDDATGYYIDPLTNLYYDAGTQYFYDANASCFLYWDPERQSYLHASSSQDEDTNESGNAASSEQTSKEEEKKKEKEQTAKKIAKDMEKWAKTQNLQKDHGGFKKPMAPIGLPTTTKTKPSAAADVGFNVLSKAKFTIELSKQKENKKLPPPAPVLPGLIASYGSDDSDGEGEEENPALDAERVVEERLTDWNKLTCLLCRRMFPTTDILQKHQQFSDLHKKNLEEYKKKSTGTVTTAKTTR